MTEPLSAHGQEEGWPFDPGTPVYWFDAHSRRHEGFYLRLDIDDLEELWGSEPDRLEFIDLMDGRDDICLVCESELDEDGECPAKKHGCPGDPFHDHPQADSIRFQAAYGIAARVSSSWPPTEHDLEFYTEVPLSQLFSQEVQ